MRYEQITVLKFSIFLSEFQKFSDFNSPTLIFVAIDDCGRTDGMSAFADTRGSKISRKTELEQIKYEFVTREW